jgi:predicted ATPase
MITQAQFTNYKLLRDVKFPLGRLNVIVGANGVGKSTALEGLSLLLAVIEGLGNNIDRRFRPSQVLETVFSGDNAPPHLASRPGATSFDLGVEVGADHSANLRTELSVSASRQGYSVLSYKGTSGNEVVDSSYSNDAANGLQVANKIQRAGVGRCVQLRLDALRLREAHYSPERDVRMAFDGEGLASVLQRIQIARDGRLEVIEKEVTRIVPFVRRIRTTQERIARVEQVPVTIEGKGTFAPHRREYVGAGFEVEWGDVGWVSSRHLSEGTLLVIGLVTLLHHDSPSLVLIDDLDKALHPIAQKEIVHMLRRCIDANPLLQILATTHSPFVVDALEPEQVLVAGSVDSRTTTIRPLSEHPSGKKQKAYLDAGEFWSAVGESWVAEKKQ